MWLELVDDGIDEEQRDEILDTLPSFNAPIKSVQAYQLHDLQMLGARSKERKAAVNHVRATMQLASDIGAQNVVIVTTYGSPGVENPREKCVEIFKKLGELGEELNVVAAIEPLSGKKTTFLPTVPEVHDVVREVGSDYVRLMLDTMHIHDAGAAVAETVGEYAPSAIELQLRDSDSKPPGQGEIDFGPIMETAREKFKGLTCLEYKPGPDSRADFDSARELISAAL